MTRYWGIRTSKQEWERINKALTEDGVLRQGWGSVDLREIGQLVSDGVATQDQRSIWRYTRRMIDIQPGDVILTPHQPNWGQNGIWRATSGYEFDPVPNVWGDQPDFGNVVHVEQLGIIDHRSDVVTTDLRRAVTSGFRSRMRQLDDHGKEIERLLADPSAAQPSDASEHWERVRKTARHELGKALDLQYRNADFEAPVEALLNVLYPGLVVKHTGGPAEHGADFVVQGTDAFGLAHNVVVQVKAWKGTAAASDVAHGLGQLARRIEKESGNVNLAVLITLANELPTDIDEQVALAEGETGVPTRVLDRDATLDLFLSHLAHMEF